MKSYTFLDLIKNILLCLKSDLKYAVHNSSKLQGHAKTLAQDGIVIIPDAVDPATCDKLKKQVLDFIDNHKNKDPNTRVQIRDGDDGEQAYDTGMIDIFNIHKSLPEIADIRKKQPVLHIVSEVMGKTAHSLNINSYINKGITNTRGYHADNIARPQYKAFIYLTDVPDDSYGPYCFVKKSFRFSWKKYHNLITNWKKGYPPSDMRTWNKDNEIHCTASKGTLVISNQNGFHRGRPQAPDKQRVILVNNIVC